MKKVLGVIGGMGTEATINFFKVIFDLQQINKDQDALEIIIHNNTKIPDRTKYVLRASEKPLKELLRSIDLMNNTGVDFICVPCNTSHYYIDKMAFHSEIPIINMIEEVIDVVVKKHITGNVGILATDGTVYSDIYGKKLKEKSIAYSYPSKEEQKQINQLIYDLKSKKTVYPNDYCRILNEFVERENIQSLILGCTELSLISGDIKKYTNTLVIDSTKILALSCLNYASL